MHILKSLAVVVLFSFLFISHSKADDGGCTEVAKRIGAYQFHRFAGVTGTDTIKCYFSALPMDNPAYYYQYRSYLFMNTGTFMVFNSYEEFDVSDGARVYTIFPRNQTPSLETIGDKPVMKSATAGFDLILHPTKSIVDSMNGTKFTEDYNINPTNKGGLELYDVQTLILDSGFTVKKDPTSDMNSTSVFKDIKGNTCSVTNSEVFKFINNDDVAFKFNDDELKSFLSTRCKNIFVNW